MSLKEEGGRKKEEVATEQSQGLPEGWETATLGDVLLDIVGGGAPPRNVPAYFDGSIPWFTVKDMKSLRPRDAEEHITEEAINNSATNLIPANTLILATRIALGRAMRPLVDCAINQDLKALTLGEGVEPDFFLYWVCAHERAIQDLGSGTTVSGIRLETLRSLPVLLPPSAEQNRIVEKLEELLSDLDAGVAELKAAQQKLAQYRQSLLKAAVEGDLTADWRRQHIPTETGAELLSRILQERRARWEAKQLEKFASQGKTPPKNWQNKYPEPTPPDTQNLPTLPEGWVWASVDQIGEVFLGKMLDKSKHITGKELPYFRNVNVRWGEIDVGDVKEMFFDDDELERYGLLEGDVLVCEGGELGRAAVCKKEHESFKYQKALHRVRLFGFYEPYLFISILETLSKSGRLAKEFTGSTINHFTKEIFVALSIPLPPLVEQKEIVSKIHAQIDEIFEQLMRIDFSLKQTTAQRQNILRATFAGELVPQDPSDEPASALLERIRAQRAAQAPAKKPRGRKKKEIQNV